MSYHHLSGCHCGGACGPCRSGHRGLGSALSSRVISRVVRTPALAEARQLPGAPGSSVPSAVAPTPAPLLTPMRIALGTAAIAGVIFLFRKRARRNPMTAEQRADLPTTSFAVPRLRKLPIHDAPHVRAAMSRFGQVRGLSDRDRQRAFDRIVDAARRNDIDASGFVARWAALS